MRIRILTIISFFLSLPALSFVENTTKGYPNCMACHISSTGGGILNNYGRSLSKELMSTWEGPNGFEKPGYGLLKNSEHVSLGGQYRTIQVKAENNKVDVEKQFEMQNNIEFAFKYMDAFLVGTIGTVEGPDETEDKDEFLSERHFVQLNLDSNIITRLGKFRQLFGINHPNHTRFTKSNLGFGSNSETYNLDLTKFFEWGEFNISTSLGEFTSSPEDDSKKRNFIVNFTHYLDGHSRLGTAVLTERTTSHKREALNLNLVHKLTSKIQIRSEFIYYTQQNIVNDKFNQQTNGTLGDHQIQYNLHKGINPYLIFERAQSNLKDKESLITAPGLGLQFLPIPHFEIQAEYSRRISHADFSNPEHRSFLTLHLYH